MSTVADIELILPKLTTEELHRIEKAVHQQFRERRDHVVFDDLYGAETESDLIASAEKAFLEYDKEEEEKGGKSNPG